MMLLDEIDHFSPTIMHIVLYVNILGPKRAKTAPDVKDFHLKDWDYLDESVMPSSIILA